MIFLTATDDCVILEIIKSHISYELWISTRKENFKEEERKEIKKGNKLTDMNDLGSHNRFFFSFKGPNDTKEFLQLTQGRFMLVNFIGPTE